MESSRESMRPSKPRSLDILPTITKAVTLQEAIAAFKELRTSRLGEMCSREAQAKMEAVNELVCNMGRSFP